MVSLLFAGFLATVAVGAAESPPSSDPEASVAVAVHRDLNQLFDDYWAWYLEREPLDATRLGVHDYGDRLPSAKPEVFAAEESALRDFLRRLKEIPRAALESQARISYDLFERQRSDDLAELTFGAHRSPITDRAGLHVEILRLPSLAPFTSLQDYESYLARLDAVPAALDERIALLEAGIVAGWTAPRAAVAGVPAMLADQELEDVRESVLYGPFETLPESFDEATANRLRQAAVRSLEQGVVPAYRRLRAFFEERYLDASRSVPGVHGLPDGEAFYRHRVRRFTTLDVEPGEVHRIGLGEVARIRGEMEAIVREVGFDGDLEAFFEHLRTDPKFYPQTEEELMSAASRVAKRIDGELPSLFGRLPRTPYGLRPVPDYLAPNTYTAYYQPPAGDGTRAGFYFLNTYALESRPLYELEALTLHEAVPGHHLQIALQQEIEGLPAFRRFAGVGAFVEGWALYAERLGLEVGFYQDPYSNFGRLSYEMWRAARLVVDTGIHALGWSRQRAIEYMTANTGLTLHNITTEVDRYIGWPGQALGYKMGELEIRRLRQQAEAALGVCFDVRLFHDVVLGAGPIPLETLGERVEEWIADTQRAPGDSADEHCVPTMGTS